MNVAVVNYGMGNLGSVRRALEDLGASVLVAAQPDELGEAERIVLPGVGAFGEGMERLRAGGWVEALRHHAGSEAKPLLGICLGMQMLASASEENGLNSGLGFIPGIVRRLDSLGCSLRIPHVGWNDVTHTGPEKLFEGIPQSTDFYFVHSYALDAEDAADVTAQVTYDVRIVAAVQRNNIFGTQFHPEKSSRAGRQLLKTFLDYAPC